MSRRSAGRTGRTSAPRDPLGQSRRGAAQLEGAEHAPPALIIDFAAAVALLSVVAFFARASLNPDGVAYLEIAESIARGQWGAVLQGYWSPGYPVLVAPLVAVARENRPLLLTLVHVLQALVGAGALWLAVVCARRRIPAAMQRTVFWVAAWIVIRWVTPELVSPDLLLCACVLGVIVLIERRDAFGRVMTGTLIGVAFLLKTSIWPWLSVAAVLALLPAARSRAWSAVPRHVLTPAGMLVGAWLIALSVHAGRPTLGSVGPLNLAWYLGDLDRRTPDSDGGGHKSSRPISLPNGTMVTFTDLRGAPETYLPWSSPERWSEGMSAGSRAAFTPGRALASWTENLLVTLRWLLPVALGLAAWAWLSGTPGRRAPARQWIGERPLLITGLAAFAVFLVVHTEIRLVAPAALLCTFGALSSPLRTRRSARLRFVAAAVIIGIAVNLAVHIVPLPGRVTRDAESVRGLNAYIDAQLARNPTPAAIIIGPATPWMSILWLHRMRVAVQFGAASRAQLQALDEPTRTAWLRETFGRDALGVGEMRVTEEGGSLKNAWMFAAW